MGPVIPVRWVPIMKVGLVVKCYDEIPVYVEDAVRKTGTVLADNTESSVGYTGGPADEGDPLT